MEKYGFFLKSSFDKSVHLSDQQKGIEYPPLEKPPPSDARLISLISPDNLSVAKKTGYSEYVGNLGVAILDGFREIGIGTEMMKTLVSKAENMGLKMLTLSVFSTNKRAKHVMRK